MYTEYLWRNILFNRASTDDCPYPHVTEEQVNAWYYDEDRTNWVTYTNCLREVMMATGILAKSVENISLDDSPGVILPAGSIQQSLMETPPMLRKCFLNYAQTGLAILKREAHTLDIPFDLCMNDSAQPFIYWGSLNTETNYERDFSPQGEQIKTALNLINKNNSDIAQDLKQSFSSHGTAQHVIGRLVNNQNFIGLNEGTVNQVKEFSPKFFALLKKYGIEFTLNRETGERGIRLRIGHDNLNKIQEIQPNTELYDTIDLTPDDLEALYPTIIAGKDGKGLERLKPQVPAALNHESDL